LGRYLQSERAGLHTFLMGTHPLVGSLSLLHLLPVEMIIEIFSYFLRHRTFRVTGLTTPWNEDQPWTDNNWCMEVSFNPYTGQIYGEGTNIGMTVLKKYYGTLNQNLVDCNVHFPATEQKSRYFGTINEEAVLNLRIEIIEPGKTSGFKGDYKYASGKWVELFREEPQQKKDLAPVPVIQDAGVAIRDGGVAIRDDGVAIQDGGLAVHNGVVPMHHGAATYDGAVVMHDGAVPMYDGAVVMHNGALALQAQALAVPAMMIQHEQPQQPEIQAEADGMDIDLN